MKLHRHRWMWLSPFHRVCPKRQLLQRYATLVIPLRNECVKQLFDWHIVKNYHQNNFKFNFGLVNCISVSYQHFYVFGTGEWRTVGHGPTTRERLHFGYTGLRRCRSEGISASVSPAGFFLQTNFIWIPPSIRYYCKFFYCNLIRRLKTRIEWFFLSVGDGFSLFFWNALTIT